MLELTSFQPWGVLVVVEVVGVEEISVVGLGAGAGVGVVTVSGGTEVV